MSLMATMNIKDPEVHRLAKTLASARRTSVTGAVRVALQEALERDRLERQGIAERLLDLGREYRAAGGAPLTDEQMYDDAGLPRW